MLSVLIGIFFLVEWAPSIGYSISLIEIALIDYAQGWFIIGAICIVGSFICITLNTLVTSFNEFKTLYMKGNNQLSSESVFDENSIHDTSQNPSEVYSSDIPKEKQDDIQKSSCDICGKEVNKSQKYFCEKCKISICYSCMKIGAKCPNCEGVVKQSL